MVACHKPKNLKDLLIPRKMKVCKERDPKASAYVEKQTWNVLRVAVKDRVKDVALDYRVSLGMRERLNKKFNLVGYDVYYNNYKKKIVFIERK